MTQYTPNDPSVQYAPPASPYVTPNYYGGPAVLPAPKRPTSVTVLAILGLIFGGMGVLGGISTLAMQGVQLKFGPPNPITDLMTKDPEIAGWNLGLGIFKLAMSVALVTGAIGAMKLNEWGRRTMLFQAMATLLSVAVTMYFSLAVLMPKIAVVPQNRPEVRLAVTIMPFTLVGGGLLALIMPLFTLYYFTRPHVKAAFAGVVEPEAPAGYP